MVIYDPVQYGSGIYGSGLGKDVPAMGPFRNYTPKLQGGKGRFAGVIKGGTILYNFARKHPYFTGGAGAIAIGAGLSGRNATQSEYNKALSANFAGKRGFRSRKKYSRNTCCCQPVKKSTFRGKRRRYY